MDSRKRPEVRVTFNHDAPLLQHLLDEELEGEGFVVSHGPEPPIERGLTFEEPVLHILAEIGPGLTVAGIAALAKKVGRAISSARARAKRAPEIVGMILGPDGDVLAEVHAPHKDER